MKKKLTALIISIAITFLGYSILLTEYSKKVDMIGACFMVIGLIMTALSLFGIINHHKKEP